MTKIITYMIYDAESEFRFFMNETNTVTHSGRSLLETCVEFIGNKSAKLAIYAENQSPRWMRDGVALEHGRRWYFTNFKNFDGNAPAHLD